MKSFIELEIKSLEEQGTFEGLASVYNNIDSVNDVVVPGAFTKTIKKNKNKVVLLWQHDPKQPIGTVNLQDSKEGLMVKGKINLETEKGKEAYALMKQGAINKMSIGYDTIIDEYKNNTRLLKELDLWEVSLVTFAANPLAEVTSVKSDEEIEFKTEIVETEPLYIDGKGYKTHEVKKGKKLSKINADKIRQCKNMLDELLSMIDEDNTDESEDVKNDDKKEDVINIETKDINIIEDHISEKITEDDQVILVDIVEYLKNIKL